MSIFRINGGKAIHVAPTTFQHLGYLERRDIQRILRDSIEVIAPDLMVIAEEFGDWSDGRRRIDLLCLRKGGGLAVVELKRNEDGGHMELQALRYAAMVSAMTFPEAVRAHEEHLLKNAIEDNAERRILEFLEWTDPTTENFNESVSIILVSAEFSKEVTTTVMWLNDFELNITCVRLRPYVVDDQVLLNVEQIIPLPEAAEYQVRVRQKEKQEREARTQERDTTRFEITIGNEKFTNLPKRKLAYYVIREAIQNGANPRDVLSIARGWIIVLGKLSGAEFEQRADAERTEESSESGIHRFFTANDELFHHEGHTYALTKMWGAETLERVTKIMKDYHLDHVRYQAISD